MNSFYLVWRQFDFPFLDISKFLSSAVERAPIFFPVAEQQERQMFKFHELKNVYAVFGHFEIKTKKNHSGKK